MKNAPTKWALGLAEAAGRTSTFYILVVWQLGWIALATIGISIFKNDKYPFIFLLFLSNLIQLWYLPLLQIKQVNDAKKHQEHHEAHMAKLDAIHQSISGGSA